MKRFYGALIAALVAVIAISTPLYSQDSPLMKDDPGTVGNDFYNNTYWAIGLNVGLLSGAGVSGRISLPGGITGQLTFFALSVPGSTYGTHANVGGELQYAFARNSNGRLYSLLGMGFYSTSFEDTTKGTGNAIANPFRIGLGIGYEWFTTRNLVFNLAAAITYFPSTSEFFPMPEAGLFYYFR